MFFTEPPWMGLSRVSEGRYPCRDDQLALTLKNSLGIRWELGTLPETRCGYFPVRSVKNIPVF